MSAFSVIVATAAVLAFLAVVVALLWGEGFRAAARGADVDRISNLGSGAELTLAAFAAARLAHDPALRPVGFVLLGMAALLMAKGSAARAASQALLTTLGALAGVAAFGELVSTTCGTGDRRAELLVASAAILVALGTFAIRMVLGGWLSRDLSLGSAALGVFALMEMAPAAVQAQGVPLLGDAGPWGARALLVTLLMLVAVGVGLRPRFSAGLLAVALAILSLGFLVVPSPCGIGVGWLLTAIVVALAMRAVGRLFPGR